MYAYGPLVIFVMCLATSDARILTPCGLAEEIDSFRNSSATRIGYSDFPLVVCIAGYRRYNTSRVVYTDAATAATGFSGTPGPRTGHYGIFGVHNPTDTDRCEVYWFRKDDVEVDEGEEEVEQDKREVELLYQLTSNDLNADFMCMRSRLLHDECIVKFYRRLCSPKMVRLVKCELTPYHRSVEVWDPIHKELLDDEFLSDEEKMSFAIEVDCIASTTENVTLGPADEIGKIVGQKVTNVSGVVGITESADIQGSTTKSVNEPTPSTDVCSTTTMVLFVALGGLLQMIFMAALIFSVMKIMGRSLRDILVAQLQFNMHERQVELQPT